MRGWIFSTVLMDRYGQREEGFEFSMFLLCRLESCAAGSAKIALSQFVRSCMRHATCEFVRSLPGVFDFRCNDYSFTL